MPRLLLEGELFELGGADLAFSPDEIAAWLQQVDPLRASRADTLFALTRGWPAALRLLAAQGEREGSGPPLCEEHNALLRDYIEHEVLQGLPAELNQALCQLAQIPRFNDELCEHLLGVGEGAAWLQALRARGAQQTQARSPAAGQAEQVVRAAGAQRIHVLQPGGNLVWAKGQIRAAQLEQLALQQQARQVA